MKLFILGFFPTTASAEEVVGEVMTVAIWTIPDHIFVPILGDGCGVGCFGESI